MVPLKPEGNGLDTELLGRTYLAAPYASFILDWNGRIQVCNRRAERSFAPGSGPLHGTCISGLTLLEPERVIARLRQGTAQDTTALPMSASMRSSAAPETEFRVSLLKSDTKGERLILLTHDQLRVTADALRHMNELRSRLRGELRDAKDANLKLQETLLTMEAFAQAASHDLRTPLSTLTGALHYFLNTTLPGCRIRPGDSCSTCPGPPARWTG
ncbi:hypothetical protein [Leisingera sp. JC11]|uniref:hypothetical protein n=1 Tax=Leisingera sp. JC11 TaxID=3042469 RepID=UPI00345265CD